MKKTKLFLWLGFVTINHSFSQCPTAGFMIPDTVCGGSPFVINNTSSSGSFQWDFCYGDLMSVPHGDTIPGDLGLNSGNQVKIIKDNGNYYAFVADYGNLNRLDFGPSLDNPSPSTFSYSGSGGLRGVDVMKEGNTWYALTTDYFNNHLYRIDLGSVIGNNTFTTTDLGNTFGFSNPKNIKIAKDNNNYFLFVANQSIDSISKIAFGSSLTNSVSSSVQMNDPSFLSLYGIDIVYDCSVNKYIGFVTNYFQNYISVIDYGNTLSNQGTVIHTLPSQYYNSGINIVRDGNDWHLLFTSYNFNKFQQLILGNDLLNPAPLAGYLDTIGNLNNPNGLNFVNDSSKWYGIISNASANTGKITRVHFDTLCTASVPSSTDSIPLNVFYTGQGWQHISLNVTNSNEYTNTFSDSVYVSAAAQADFILNSACTGFPVSFTDNSTIAQGSIISWQWNFGDGSPGSNLQNPVHTYSTDSTYLVTLTVTSDALCISSFSDSVTVFGLPMSVFSFPNNQCSETPIQFNDLSTAAQGDAITGWEWNFGDNSPLVFAQSPVHAYDTSGTFTVQLIVSGSTGCSDTSTQSITILPRPVNAFAISQTCVGETTIFSNGTTISDGSALSYTWYFGDGDSSMLQNPVHLYPLVPSSYPVQLIAASSNGCKDTLFQNLRISTRANPGFTLTPNTACAGNTIMFVDTSTIAGGDTIAFSTWDFGDANSATGDTVTHVYAASGTYTVTLTVTSLTSCDTSYSKTITVIESPEANFTFNNVCLGSPVTFNDSSTTPPGSNIVSYIWSFGDNDSAFVTNPVHIYGAAGIYNVTETVINDAGCIGTISHQVTVYEMPVAFFTTNGLACSGNNLSFTDLSTVQNDSIVSYFWDFGNGNSSMLQNPSNIFSSAQTYQVVLTVTSSHGCQNIIQQNVMVNLSPSFNFNYSSACLGDSTHFYYVPVQGSPNTWLWKFGDNTAVSPLVNPVHYYNAAGTYNVILTVTALNACSKTDSMLVIVNPKPLAGIISDTIACLGTTMIFTDNSTVSSGAIAQWIWSFGDGSPAALTQNTIHNYANASAFTVMHTVVSDSGCAESKSLTVYIEPLPIASFIPNPNFGSPPLSVQFQNTSTGASNYLWNFGDLNTSSLMSPANVYNDTGVYHVSLIASNIFGCSDTAYYDISVLIPFLDLGIDNIHAVKSNNLLALSANLVNFGNVPIGKFQIRAKTETGSPINEQWLSANTLKPGDAFTYNFAARYEIDPAHVPSFYCIEISDVNDTMDAVELNNKKCAAVNETFELFDIYPNPTNDQIHIGLNVPLDGVIDISIYDEAGQLMKQEISVKVTKGFNEFNYSVRDFAKGFYACTVKYRDDLLVKKIVKR